MKNFLLLFLILVGVSPRVMSEGARLKYGQKIVVDHLVYRCTYQGGWGVDLVGVTDEFYMPSLLKVPDEIVYDGEKLRVKSVGGGWPDDTDCVPFSGSKDIVKVELGKNVKSVDGFSGCKELISVKLNSGLEEIMGNAFSNTGLTSIELPPTLQTIGRLAFAGCKLESVTIPPSVKMIDDNALQCESLGNIIFTPCDTAFTEPWLEIKRCMGYNDQYGKLTSVTLPAHLKYVDPASFCGPPVAEYKVAEGCRNYFVIDGVLYANDGLVTAYSYPLGRTDETWIVPKELSGGKIGGSFFVNNKKTFNCSLKNIDFSQLTEPIEICSEAFTDIDAETLDLQNVYKVEDNAFNDYDIIGINIGAALEKVGPGKICKSNTKYTVDPANTHFVEWEGSLCRMLDDGNRSLVQYYAPYKNNIVTIPENIVEIGDKAFYISEVKEINLPSTLRRIGSRAFEFANNLTKMTCNSRVVDYISSYAFGTYGKPPVISNHKGAFMIGNWLFRWIGKIDNPNNIRIPSEATVIGFGAFSKFCDANESYYTMLDYFDNLTSITIPEGIVRIEDMAFRATPLSSVSLPQSLKYIGSSAFRNSELVSVGIPVKLDSISDYAFCACKLEEITVPERVSYVGAFAFYNNPAKKVTIGRANSAFTTVLDNNAFGYLRDAETIYIGNNVVSIGNSTFTNLAVNVPNPIEIELNGVREIGYGAFSGGNIKKIAIGPDLEKVHMMAFDVKHNIEYDYTSDIFPSPILGGSSTLENIKIAAVNPPLFIKNDEQDERLCSDVIYGFCTLTVPSGSEEAYKASTVWSSFFDLNGDNWLSDNIDNTTIDSMESGCKLLNRTLNIFAAKNVPVIVATVDGRVIYKGYGSAVVELNPGMIVVRVGSDVKKYIVR